MRVTRFRQIAVTVAMIAALQFAALPAGTADETVATIDHIVTRNDRSVQVFVNSPAMQRIVRVDVLTPANSTADRPTLYLLDGTAARDDQPASSWLLRTDVEAFTADKPMNVVMPVGGGGTMYTDWQQDDPRLGHVKWETFLTKELPPIIDSEFGGNGVNAISGLSAGGMAAFSLAARNPALYKSVGAYSPCLLMSDPIGQTVVRTSVISRGGNPSNMWGPVGDPDWAAHDPAKNLGTLRGKPLYISTGTGVPGPLDTNFNPEYQFPADLAGAMVQEQGAHDCTRLFQTKLRFNRVPATFKFNWIGTHSWPYWQIALHDSWRVLRKGLNI